MPAVSVQDFTASNGSCTENGTFSNFSVLVYFWWNFSRPANILFKQKLDEVKVQFFVNACMNLDWKLVPTCLLPVGTELNKLDQTLPT